MGTKSDVSILTSLSGRDIGLNSTRDLVVGGAVITDNKLERGTPEDGILEDVVDSGTHRKVMLTLDKVRFEAIATVTSEGQPLTIAIIPLYNLPDGTINIQTLVVEGVLKLNEANWIDTFRAGSTVYVPGTIDGGVDEIEFDAREQQAEINFVIGGIIRARQESKPRMYLQFTIEEHEDHASGTGVFSGVVEFIYSVIG